jgi:hypothetical protein
VGTLLISVATASIDSQYRYSLSFELWATVGRQAGNSLGFGSCNGPFRLDRLPNHERLKPNPKGSSSSSTSYTVSRDLG